MGAGEELKAGSSIPWNRKAAIVCSLMYIKGHNVLVRLRRSLEGVLNQVIALSGCPSGTVHPTVDRRGFTRPQT